VRSFFWSRLEYLLSTLMYSHVHCLRLKIHCYYPKRKVEWSWYGSKRR
jgi:hypothetical protein